MEQTGNAPSMPQDGEIQYGAKKIKKVQKFEKKISEPIFLFFLRSKYKPLPDNQRIKSLNHNNPKTVAISQISMVRWAGTRKT